MSENDNTHMTLGERFEELLEIDLVRWIFIGLSVAATIIFALLTIVMFFVAIFANTGWDTILVFILCGLITGVAAGFSIYLFDNF